MSSSRPIPFKADNAYKWLRDLGRGSFGRAYLAESTELVLSSSTGAREESRHEPRRRKRQYLVERRESTPRLVAIKVLQHRRDDLSCLREASLFSACQSPHILEFFEAFYISTSAMSVETSIVMEYCRHGTLFDLVDGVIDYNESRAHIAEFVDIEIPVECIRHAISSLTIGVEYLHIKLNIIHRDLKTDNCFIDGNGIVKVGDFGLSIRRSDLSREGRMSTMVGGAHYQAPEAHRLISQDDISEVWPLGIITIELAELNYPHASHSSKKALRGLICDGQAPTLSDDHKWGDTSTWDMLSFVQLCCEKNHAERPNSTVVKTHCFITPEPRGDHLLEFIRGLNEGTIGSPTPYITERSIEADDNVSHALFFDKEDEVPGLVNVDTSPSHRGLLKRSRSSSSSSDDRYEQRPRRLLNEEGVTDDCDRTLGQQIGQSSIESTELQCQMRKNHWCRHLKGVWEETYSQLEPCPLEYYEWFAAANDFDFAMTWEGLKAFRIRYSIANMEKPLLQFKATFPISGVRSKAGHELFYFRPGGYTTTEFEAALDLVIYIMSSLMKRARDGIGAIINMAGFSASFDNLSLFERLLDVLFGGQGPVSVDLVYLMYPPGTSPASWQLATSDYKDKISEISLESLRDEIDAEERFLPAELVAGGRRTDQILLEFIDERKAVESPQGRIMHPD